MDNMVLHSSMSPKHCLWNRKNVNTKASKLALNKIKNDHMTIIGKSDADDSYESVDDDSTEKCVEDSVVANYHTKNVSDEDDVVAETPEKKKSDCTNSEISLNADSSELTNSFNNASICDDLKKTDLNDEVIVINSSPEIHCDIANKSDEKTATDPIKINVDVNTCTESTLDELYGDMWRKNQAEVLTKSEPRYKIRKSPNILPKHLKTERKPKLSLLYKNPYLENESAKSRNLLRTMQAARFQAALESPAVNRWRDLCDPDSDSSGDTGPFRKRLDFSDEIESSGDENVKSPDMESRTPEIRKLDPPKVDVKPLQENVSSEKTAENDVKKGGKKTYKKRQPRKAVVYSSSSDSESSCNIWDVGSSDSDSNTNTNKVPVIPKKIVEDKQQWKKPKTYGFLTSLSKNIPQPQCDPAALIYRNNYKKHKDELAQKLFKLYNETVFDNAIAEDTPLEWSTRMRGTAGFCYCRRAIKDGITKSRSVRLVLSTKVLDTADRLRDTLLHEMCHAATWVVNHKSDGHGAHWKRWADKAMKTYPELPPIKRCHDYEIATKYTYKCVDCGYSIGRHSKSLDVERKLCGHCHGRFEVLVNKMGRNGDVQSTPTTPKKPPTGFALFVKENYATVKTPRLNHGDVMRILGQKFSEMKLAK